MKNGYTKIPGGYILQPRRLDESEVMKEPPIVRELWLYLIRKVNWKDGKLPRGTGFFRFADIQNDLCWYVGFRKMKYSKPRLTKALRRLCEGNMTETMKATRGIVITILNYDYYQDPNNYEGNNEDPMKILRRSKGRNTIIKEREEVKEEKENTLPDFIPEELWEDFKEHRNKLKGTMTKKAEKLNIGRIEKFSSGNPKIARALIEQSIENGWKGIFPLKDQPAQSTEEIFPY